MAEETGANLYAAWVYGAVTAGGASLAAGTLVLSTDYRTATPIDDTQQSVDKSAGADEERTYLKTLRDGKHAMTFLDDGGTTLPIILAAGTDGTLVFGPSGTANGKLKITKGACITQSRLTSGYDQLKIWELQWQPSTVRAYSTWNNGA